MEIEREWSMMGRKRGLVKGVLRGRRSEGGAMGRWREWSRGMLKTGP